MLSFINIMDYLGFYCAPCLLGKKPASLFSIPMDVYKKSHSEIEVLKKLGFVTSLLYELNRKAYLLIFSEKQARELFYVDEVKRAYIFFGYEESFTFEDLMRNLFVKFSQFRIKRVLQHSDVFPHEIGLFLGYPAEDVLQYYIKKGRDYLFSGYWKVYSNPEKATETFKLYDKCRDCCMKGMGVDFYHLLSA